MSNAGNGYMNVHTDQQRSITAMALNIRDIHPRHEVITP